MFYKNDLLRGGGGSLKIYDQWHLGQQKGVPIFLTATVIFTTLDKLYCEDTMKTAT